MLYNTSVDPAMKVGRTVGDLLHIFRSSSMLEHIELGRVISTNVAQTRCLRRFSDGPAVVIESCEEYIFEYLGRKVLDAGGARVAHGGSMKSRV